MFDPTRFLPLSERLSPVPQHGPSWSTKFANWWGGATVASPTREVAAPALQSVKAVRRFLDDRDRLIAYYNQDMDYSRYLIRQLLDLEETTPVIFEASGAAGILLASRLFSHISTKPGRFFTVTVDEGSSFVPEILAGHNVVELDGAMFQPSAALFYEAIPVLPYPTDLQVQSRLVELAGYGNAELVQVFKDAVWALSRNATTAGCVVLPQVSKTGRLLPVREIAQALDQLRAQGVEVYYIVDAGQSIGRVSAEEIARPTSFCDAFVFDSSKALGGLLSASTVIVKRELLDRFVESARAGEVEPQVRFASHYQFDPEDEQRLPAEMLKPGAISIPEVVAMREGVRLHYLRGQGNSFAEKRRHQLALIEKQRSVLVTALRTVPGIEVLDGDADRPIVPSIVCFKPPPGRSADEVKDALELGAPVITPSASVGPNVRLEIAEYRSMPSVEVLVGKLREILSAV